MNRRDADVLPFVPRSSAAPDPAPDAPGVVVDFELAAALDALDPARALTPDEEALELRGYSVASLRAMAREEGIAFTTRTTKEELVECLVNRDCY